MRRRNFLQAVAGVAFAAASGLWLPMPKPPPRLTEADFVELARTVEEMRYELSWMLAATVEHELLHGTKPDPGELHNRWLASQGRGTEPLRLPTQGVYVKLRAVPANTSGGPVRRAGLVSATKGLGK